ncbi:hypothetical protein [Silanimonas sp.]|jgi:hypothetical protein|uniref:hypothetical protein n=1 Tax=Silanimonas sp. TaxID=1929290 RepID=UPI0022BD1E6A|nr:hypothetical protein [Silanimonas sp.]MCZ8116349.1 hypothetical protein [Silanimonas sp.]
MTIMARLDDITRRWSWAKLGLALTASFLLGAIGLTWATVLYVRSGFPPALIEGQLAFDPHAYRAWYAVLIDKGTLPIYVRTQFVDYLFIAGLLATLFVVHLMIAKAQPKPRWRTLALTLAVLGPVIAASDAIENIVTLTMLSNPTGFAPWLGYLVSTISSVKWSWALIGCTLICVQIVALAWFRRHRSTAGLKS